jgi:hypothetical protein
MFVAEPVFLHARPDRDRARASRARGRARRTLRAVGKRVVRGLSETRQLLAWHRRQRPSGAAMRVSERAWRRQSALICLRAGLDPEAGR